MSDNIREIVLDTLYELETGDKKSHLLIRDVLDKYDYLDARDKAFYKRVSEGTITTKLTLDYVLNCVSKKPMDKCKPMVRCILRMSAYQILYMDKIPEHAVIDEAVKLCRKRSFEEFCKFINGILRALVERKDELTNFDSIEDNILRLSVKYSMPEGLVRMFLKEQDNAEELLKAFGNIRPVCVKVRRPEMVDKLTLEWKNLGIEVLPCKLIENAFYVKSLEGAYSLAGFSEGELIIQDESSMLVGLATGLKKGDDKTVIDVCAAPGGKTSCVADIMYPNGLVLSFDVSEKKTSLIDENIERLKLTNVTVDVHDATILNEELIEKADVLICDVPCSGLGIIGRKADIRYNITNENMKSICDLQKEIVNTVWRYVKPGGVMIYSTCTIHKAENEKMVKYILNNLPFEGDSIKALVPSLYTTERESENYVQLLPNVDETDGFFIARFIRRG